jgi:hypothetical protein
MEILFALLIGGLIGAGIQGHTPPPAPAVAAVKTEAAPIIPAREYKIRNLSDREF